MNDTQDISLYNMLRVFRKRWKTLLLFPVIATLAALLTTFFLPKAYYASTTVLPVNSALGDRSRLFNDNIQALYSNFGTSDDLDRLYTITAADDVLYYVADVLQLATHYQLTGNSDAVMSKTIKRLRANVSISKTPNGALAVEVWDKDDTTAASIANMIIYRGGALYKQLNAGLNQNVINVLRKDNEEKRLRTHAETDTVDRRTQQRLTEQIERNEKLIDEIRITMQTEQPPLVVLEKALPALKAGKPRVLLIVLSTFILAFFFAAVCVLVIERNRNHERAVNAT